MLRPERKQTNKQTNNHFHWRLIAHKRIVSGRAPERDTSRAVSVLAPSKTAISCLGCSQIRKQQVFFKKDSNAGGEDTVLPASVTNWVLNNLIAERRFRPTRAQAPDLSEQLHLAVILTPSLPYFLSPYLHSLPHLRREHKGAKSLQRISIATVSRPFKNTCSAAALLIRDLCWCKAPPHVASDGARI